MQDDNFIADLKNYDYVGRKIIDGQECAIYSANADGSCCYHAYCAMIRAQVEIIDADCAKALLLDFYGNCNNAILKTSFEKLLGTRFEDRYKEITKPGHWGEQIELYALARKAFSVSNNFSRLLCSVCMCCSVPYYYIFLILAQLAV